MELAQITSKLVQMERCCQALDAEIQTEAVAYRLQTEQGLAIEDILEWHGRMEARHAALQEARLAVAALTEGWNHTQGRLVEASQERKILDRLVDRRQQSRMREHRHREQHATDEAASRRHLPPGARLS